jgi:hypothetical protein
MLGKNGTCSTAVSSGPSSSQSCGDNFGCAVGVVLDDVAIWVDTVVEARFGELFGDACRDVPVSPGRSSDHTATVTTTMAIAQYDNATPTSARSRPCCGWRLISDSAR